MGITWHITITLVLMDDLKNVLKALTNGEGVVLATTGMAFADS